ncbi:hypothetical protein QFC21_006119 [Naganishia friedmannii]|uniref:Uncharacterized protein n=1 Tax=Naganishia friedmannii TaxID=89922 RepID=A0ACC2V595_9TREE|nr:hypothetical protein QFC21_006119 [Naganishia friedmannii]
MAHGNKRESTRNVPGVAVYFYLLNEIRYTLSTTGYFAAAPSAATHTSSLAVVAARVPHTIRDASLVVGETFPAPPPASIDLSLVAPEQAVSSSSALFSPTAAAAGKRAVSGGGSTIPRLQETGIGTTTAIETEGVPQRMTSALPKLNLQGNLVAGAVARTSVGFVLNPFTVLKSRQLLRTEGLRGLFQGFTATAARDAPYAGIYVVFYEEMKEVLGMLTHLNRP